MFRQIMIAAMALVLTTSIASACPMCKDSIGNDESKAAAAMPAGLDGTQGPTSGLPGGFNTSVYIMLATFFGVLGLVSLTIVRGARSGSVATAPASANTPQLDEPSPSSQD